MNQYGMLRELTIDYNESPHEAVIMVETAQVAKSLIDGGHKEPAVCGSSLDEYGYRVISS